MSAQTEARLFGVDVRSLAAFRIGLAVLVLADLFNRAFYLEAHYTDAGVLPRDFMRAVADEFHWGCNWSLHMLSGEAWFQAALFGAAAVFALMLLVGYHSRLACVASWVMAASLQSRNPLPLQGGDALLLMLLFWGMFVPLGAAWSWDRLRRPDPETPDSSTVSSPGTVGLLSQLCFMYIFTAAMKWHPVWVSEFTAVEYALRVEQFATPLGSRLLEFPGLLKVLTMMTVALELFGPLLVLLLYSPARSGMRTAMVAAFVGFHLLGLGACMKLGLFPYICTVAWLAFLPGRFWGRPSVSRLTGLVARWAAKVASLSPRLPALPLPSQETAAGMARASRALAVFFVVYVLLWNLRTVDHPTLKHAMPKEVQFVGRSLRVGQRWNMFAPRPMTHDGWYVMEAKLADGRVVDPFAGGSPSSDVKPEYVAGTYPSQRWRKLMMRLWGQKYATFRRPLGEWVMRKWNREHGPGEQMVSLNIYFMLEETDLKGPPRPAEKTLFWSSEDSAAAPESLPGGR